MLEFMRLEFSKKGEEKKNKNKKKERDSGWGAVKGQRPTHIRHSQPWWSPTSHAASFLDPL